MLYFEVSMNLEIIYGTPSTTLSWPSTLPQAFLLNGFNLAPTNSAIKSDTDSGPSYQRPRFSVSMDTLKGSMAMSKDQVSLFWTFYNTTLMMGALQFTMSHPFSGVTLTFQFDTSQPPQVVSMNV